MQQEERVRVKQGKLGYFIGHQTHVQSAEADEEVVIKPGGGGGSGLQHTSAGGGGLLLMVLNMPCMQLQPMWSLLQMSVASVAKICSSASKL